MDCAPVVEGVGYRAAELGELIYDSQHNSIAARFFVGECRLTEADIKQGLEKMAKIYPSVEEVDIHRPNRDASRLFPNGATRELE